MEHDVNEILNHSVIRIGLLPEFVWGNENAATAVAIGRTIAFLLGSLFSYLVGFVGMNVAVAANVRVAEASRGEGGLERRSDEAKRRHEGTLAEGADLDRELERLTRPDRMDVHA